MLSEFQPYKIIDQELFLYVKVTPSAASNRFGKLITEQGQTWLKLYITAAPEGGKANKAIIDFLAKELRLTKSQICIVRGELHSHKILSISSPSRELLLDISSIV